jgi:hypothetical protein
MPVLVPVRPACPALAEKIERVLQLDGTSSTAKKWERYEFLQQLIDNFGPPMEEFKRKATRLRDEAKRLSRPSERD